MEPDEKKSADNKEMMRSLAGAGESVLAIAVLAVVGIYGGGWLDLKLHTSPWIQVVGAMAGVGLGLGRMVKKALQSEQPSTPQK